MEFAKYINKHFILIDFSLNNVLKLEERSSWVKCTCSALHGFPLDMSVQVLNLNLYAIIFQCIFLFFYKSLGNMGYLELL